MVKKPKQWPGEPDGLWQRSSPVRLRDDTRSAGERLASLENAVTLPYPRAARIRGDVLDLVKRGRRPPYVGTIIAGPRSNGRSTLAQQIVDDLRHSAWLMTMPTRCAFDDFWLALIAKAGHYCPYAYKLPSAARQIEEHEALATAKRRGLRLIIVDGCENLLDVSAARRRLMLHCAMAASTASKIPFVLVGTPALASRILSERDRVGLYEALFLHRWHLDEDFLDLLQAWEVALPLTRSSVLTERELAMHLYALCDGILGVLAGILEKAASAAILTGQEKISIALLDELGFEIPQSFSGFLF